ncbi:hypothetical protein DYB37_007525 [Aphanomyces astaci]|uniref:Glycosyltransferase 2-like domain-containing protein n=2 Tax=Aphanomyces astaci TaxID=112090 RepID=A0A3R7AMB8_APHAT|nr:hypothetical protein DYB35_008063 [Aphanomyces astaci]RHZ10303.1 hypothetical protein DYB37_007525 [Aphanomyces astaci]
MRLATVARMLLMLIAAAMVAGLDSQPEHDGFTTYCWKSKDNPLAKDLNETMKLVESHDRGCPVQLRLETTGTMVTKDGELVVGVLEALRVKWTAVASDVTSSANAFNLTRLYTIVTPISQYVQIPHSNLHACEFGPRPCTPFDRGENPTDNTPNQEMNFTTGKAQFEEPDLRFSKPGQYSLLAHVVLPGEAPSIRYDFVVYKKIVVKDVAPPPPPSEPVPVASTNNNNTLYAVLGCVATLVLVAVAALVVNLQKRKNYASSKEVDIEEATTTVPNLTTSYPSTHNRPDTIYSQDQTFSFAPSSEHSSCSDRRMPPPMSTFEVRLGHLYHQPPPLPPPAHRDQFHYDDIEYRQPPPQYDPDRMYPTRSTYDLIYLHSGAQLDHRLLPEIPTPDDLDALALQAADAHGRGRRHIALAKLTMLVLFQPHNPFVLNDLGATLAQEQGQNDVALSYYGRAMAVDSTDAHVRYNMGNTLMAMKRYDHIVRMYILLFGLAEVLHWTASVMAELEDNDRSLSRQVLQPLGALVAAMLVAYPAHMRFNCVQSVLTNEFDVHFRLNTSFEQVVRRTQLAYDRSWNVFGLALQATRTSQNITILSLVYLAVQYYRTADASRQLELDTCLRSNLANDHIAQVHVLVEGTPGDLTPFVNGHGGSKLHVTVVPDRLTMRAALEYANKTRPHAQWVIANADIHFDSSLRMLVDGPRLPRNQVVALTRWQYNEVLNEVTFHPRIDSHDAWAVYPAGLPRALLPQVDFYLGYLRTDTRFVAALYAYNVSVVNWGFQVRAIHRHTASHRAYTSQHTAWGADAYLLLSLFSHDSIIFSAP